MAMNLLERMHSLYDRLPLGWLHDRDEWITITQSLAFGNIEWEKKVDADGTEYDGKSDVVQMPEGGDPAETEVVSSLVVDQHDPTYRGPKNLNELEPHSAKIRSKHKVLLDVDMPVLAVRSSNEGHYHLYIDKELFWGEYRELLNVLAKVGIIQVGYKEASERRGYTTVRNPWVKKDPTDPTKSVTQERRQNYR